ncbi:MAG: hypothetical protein RIF32_23735 [Leptospirales bacterium]
MSRALRQRGQRTADDEAREKLEEGKRRATDWRRDGLRASRVSQALRRNPSRLWVRLARGMQVFADDLRKGER